MKQSPKELKHQNDLRRIFIKELDKDELLLKDYSCTYHKDIIIRGRLYITSHMLCFHSSMLGWGNQITISFDDITSILKRRIVLLLPNALAICAKGKKFVFSSFKNRNQAFNHLFKVWQNVLMNSPLSPEALYAHMNDDKTPLVVNDSNSVMGKTTATEAGALKRNESDSSNDDLEEQTTKSIARTNGNNSDEASGYFTDERVNTSVEDVSTMLALPPATVDYLSSSSSSQTDSCDSNSNLELKLGLADDSVMNTTEKTKLKASGINETPVNRLENSVKPIVKCNGLSTNLIQRLRKQCTTLNMLNLMMILMICLVIFTTGLLLCELSIVDPGVNKMLSHLPVLSKWSHTQQHYTAPDDLRIQLEMVHQLSTDLKTLLLHNFSDRN